MSKLRYTVLGVLLTLTTLITCVTAQARVNFRVEIVAPPPPPYFEERVIGPRVFVVCHRVPGGWYGDYYIHAHRECEYRRAMPMPPDWDEDY